MQTLPHSTDAEQGVLGALLYANDAFVTVGETGLSAEDFYSENHAELFRTMSAMLSKGELVDVITLTERLKNDGTIDRVGGLVYVNQLVDSITSSANVKRYAEIVKASSIRRRIVTVSDLAKANAIEPNGKDASELLQELERQVLAIGEGHENGRGFVSLKEASGNVLERLIEVYQARQDGVVVSGVSTGFKNLDNVTTGLQRGDLIVLAARPSMGKTSLAINVAEHVAIESETPQPVAIFSMEMSAEQIAQRILSSQAQVDSQAMRKGELSDGDWRKIAVGIDKVSSAPLFIDDTPALTVTSLASRARRLTARHGRLGLIVVDYIQLMPGNGGRNENRVSALSEVSRGLKALARELDVPIIVLSQLNRQVDSRTDKRPFMSDLRESGAIEQDADVVAFIYRDVVYNKDTIAPDMAELIVSKQRNGAIGTLRMKFNGSCTRFHAWDGDQGYWEGNPNGNS